MTGLQGVLIVHAELRYCNDLMTEELKYAILPLVSFC